MVGYSGDGAGRDAAKLCAQLAAALGSEVTIVYPYSPLFSSATAQVVEEGVREELRALVSDGEMLAHATYHWSSSSWPIHALHSMAHYEHAGLIVVGAAREGVAGHLHVGLMERMVHGAPCAVLVAPAGYAERNAGALRRVGVGFADSAEDKTALRLGHELAESFDGELSVIAAAWLSPLARSYAAQAASVSTLEAETYRGMKASVQSAMSELARGLPVRAHTVQGNPVDVLVGQSRELDLLVLGSRAYGPVRHALLGSVSAAVMREAQCPVLVMPRGCEPATGERADREAASASVAAT